MRPVRLLGARRSFKTWLHLFQIKLHLQENPSQKTHGSFSLDPFCQGHTKRWYIQSNCHLFGIVFCAPPCGNAIGISNDGEGLGTQGSCKLMLDKDASSLAQYPISAVVYKLAILPSAKINYIGLLKKFKSSLKKTASSPPSPPYPHLRQSSPCSWGV